MNPAREPERTGYGLAVFHGNNRTRFGLQFCHLRPGHGHGAAEGGFKVKYPVRHADHTAQQHGAVFQFDLICRLGWKAQGHSEEHQQIYSHLHNMYFL